MTGRRLPTDQVVTDPARVDENGTALPLDVRQRLVEVRTAAGLDHEDVARLAGLTHHYVANAEAGRFRPTAGVLVRWCEALGITDPESTEVVAAGRKVLPKPRRPSEPIDPARLARLARVGALVKEAERLAGEERLNLLREARRVLKDRGVSR